MAYHNRIIRLHRVFRNCQNYFGKNRNWILQQLYGYEVNGKPVQFKSGEITIFVKALRDIAAMLNQAADRIDKG